MRPSWYNYISGFYYEGKVVGNLYAKDFSVMQKYYIVQAICKMNF